MNIRFANENQVKVQGGQCRPISQSITRMGEPCLPRGFQSKLGGVYLLGWDGRARVRIEWPSRFAGISDLRLSHGKRQRFGTNRYLLSSEAVHSVDNALRDRRSASGCPFRWT
jgi:hypothetical protein